MSRSGLPHDAVVYPTSDGRPMAETGTHGECIEPQNAHDRADHPAA